MQRSDKPKWKKIGGGSLTLRGGRTIQFGGQFRAYDSEIPQAFRDVVRQIVSGSSRQEEVAPPESNLEIRHKGGGWYSLMDTRIGEAINSSGMRYDEAQQFADMTVEQAKKQLPENSL